MEVNVNLEVGVKVKVKVTVTENGSSARMLRDILKVRYVSRKLTGNE